MAIELQWEVPVPDDMVGLEALLDRMAWQAPAKWHRDPFLGRLGRDAAAVDALRDDEDLLASLRGLDEDAAAAALAARA